MDCPQCHTSNPAGGKFCVQCGLGLENAAPPTFRDRRCQAIFETLSTALTPKFELLDSLGSGGMGYVFLALHRQLNSKVAIKVLHESCNSDPALVTRFHREAKAAAQLSHPNIIPIFDIGVAADFNYFVMMYIEGRDLGSILEHEGALPLQQALSYAVQIARALDYAHRRGIVHRDVKPANILIERDGTAIVTDFGIARMQAAGRLTTQGAIIGTPHYMSPEQARGDTVDYRADIYSLGCVLFQMVTGRLPFDAGDINALVYKHIFEPPPSPRQWRPETPEELESAIRRMMAKSPADRFADAQSVTRTLSRMELSAGKPFSPEPVSLASGSEARDSAAPEATRLVTRSDLPFEPVFTASSTPDETSEKVSLAELSSMALKSAHRQTEKSAPLQPVEPAPGKASLEELSSMALKSAYLKTEKSAPVQPVEPVVETDKAEITLQELAALAVQTQHAQTQSRVTGPVTLPVPVQIPKPQPSAPLAGVVADEREQKTILADSASLEREQKTILADSNSFAQVESTRLVSLDDLIEQELTEEKIASKASMNYPPEPAAAIPGAHAKLPIPVIVAAAGALIVIALAVWFFAFRGTSDRQAATSDPGGSPGANSAPIETLAPTPTVTLPVTTASSTETQPAESDWLARAESAFRARRLTSPEGDNALFYYKKAAETADTRARAEQGIQRVAHAYMDMGRSAENSRQTEKARAYFMKALDIDPQLAEAWTAVNRLTQSKTAEPVAAADTSRSQPGAARGVVEEPPAIPAVAPVSPAVPVTTQKSAPPAESSAKARPSKIYEVSEVDKKPDIVRQTAPDYPRSARQKGLEDIIVLRILLSDTGAVLETKVLRAARVDPQFEKSAEDAVRRWQFSPATKGGRAVSVWYNVAVPFQLRK